MSDMRRISANIPFPVPVAIMKKAYDGAFETVANFY
jgi:hypothetical protein